MATNTDNEKQYDNELSGVLFRNNKDGNEKRPDYKGYAQVQGQRYWVSAWVRKAAATGKPYMSLALTAEGDVVINKDTDIPF